MLSRKDFLKAIPVAALIPRIMGEGVARYDLEQAGHFLFFVDVTKVDIDALCNSGNSQAPLMPKGSKGGWIISVYGDVENAVKIFRLDEKPSEEILKTAIQLKNA